MHKPDPAASLAADMRHLPLCVTGGFAGYRLAFAAGDFNQPVNHADFAADPAPPIEFTTAAWAKHYGDEALTLTQQLLDRVLQS